MVSGTFAANGSSAEYYATCAGDFPLTIHGTWRSCTATLYIKIPGGTVWHAMESGAWTANADQMVKAIEGARYKLTLSGAGSPIPALEYCFGI